MRHRYFGKKLSRTKNQRRSLFQGLVIQLIIHGSIKTTLAKAKAVQPLVEKLITKAKRGKQSDLRQIQKKLVQKEAIRALLLQAKTRFVNRSSGFTRIMRRGTRMGDNGLEAVMSFVDESAAEGLVGKSQDSVVKSNKGSKEKIQAQIPKRKLQEKKKKRKNNV